MEVWCGMIVGFDNDDDRIFDAQREFIRQAGIVHAMVGMLSAIPKTPLYARLPARAGSTSTTSRSSAPTSSRCGMTREELRDGYVGLMRDLYDADAYFERLENLFLTRRFDFARARNAYWRQHPWQKWRVAVGRCRASDRPVPTADEERSRPGVAADLSPSDDDDAPPPARPERVVHLRGQVRDALPPLHDVAPDGRTANAGQHVLEPTGASPGEDGHERRRDQHRRCRPRRSRSPIRRACRTTHSASCASAHLSPGIRTKMDLGSWPSPATTRSWPCPAIASRGRLSGRRCTSTCPVPTTSPTCGA